MQNKTRKPSSVSLLRAFAGYYRPHARIFALDLLCALAIALVDVLFPVVTRRMLYVYIPQGLGRTLALASLMMLCFFVLRTACQWFVCTWATPWACASRRTCGAISSGTCSAWTFPSSTATAPAS